MKKTDKLQNANKRKNRLSIKKSNVVKYLQKFYSFPKSWSIYVDL